MMRFVMPLCGLASSALACGEGQMLVARTSDAPSAEILFDDVPRAAPFSLTVQFCDGEGPQDIQVDALMPAHQHGMNYDPVVSAQGQGTYRVDGMLFHMPGHWEIRVDARFGADTTTYTYDALVK